MDPTDEAVLIVVRARRERLKAEFPCWPGTMATRQVEKMNEAESLILRKYEVNESPEGIGS